MNPPLIVATVLALATGVATARTLWLRQRQTPSSRPRIWRTTLLVAAQATSAALLYQVLFPPQVAREAGVLVVLTAQADAVDPESARTRPGAPVIALPESNTSLRPGTERFPDLASALRHYPATGHIRVAGAGLVARDRGAVAGRAVEFLAAPLTQGLVELHAPARVPVGHRFAVTGRVIGPDGGSAELHDPAGSVIYRDAIDDEGGFELHASTRSAGVISYRLQIRDAGNQVVNDLVVPLQATPGHPLRVLVMAGAPNPELKFLRRWASDADAELDTSISLGAGLQIGTTAIDFSAPGLDKLDLLVLDNRSWRGLGNSQRTALAAAVDRGLGVLLRLAGPVNAADRKRLDALGFSVADNGAANEIRLADGLTGTGTGSSSGATNSPGDEATPTLPILHNSAPRVSAVDGVVLLADADGMPVSLWRAQGRGRVGVSTLSDSYRLVLAGRPDVHGQLWSEAFSTLARAVPVDNRLTVDAAAPGQRSVICGIGEHASVTTPSGSSVPLARDPAAGSDHCAGFWSETSGWHQLHDADRTLPFHIRDPSAAPGLSAYALQQATRALATTAGVPGGSATSIGKPVAGSAPPGRRLPWLLAWLLLTAGAWWLERSRWGLPRSRPGTA